MPVFPINPVVPDHVPADLVYDYEVYAPGPPGSDFHEELYKLKRSAPPIFWTRLTGGHWYVTDTALVRELLGDPARFSNRNTTLPVSHRPQQGYIPVNLDPPEHGHYRKPLSRAFSLPRVAELEASIRLLARELVEELRPRGECEFVRDFASKLPVITFLRLFDLPLSDRPWLMTHVGELMRPGSDKAGILRDLTGYLAGFVARRYADPGSDLISELGLEQIDGRRMPEADLLNMATLLLIGGLDSVANTLGFIARFLAENPGHRHRIIESSGRMSVIVDECLRRFPTTAVGTGRLCTADTRLGPAPIKAGDMLMTSTAMLNFDDATFPEPLQVDFDRRRKPIGTFGDGPHHCVGGGLTRLEITIFLQEWLACIPDFELADTRTAFVPGPNISYDRVPLRWEAG